ncbi:MAG TPA: HAD-IC family P-type ATPase, partial [Pirellulaceae bacterium]|nr:HAD-IC family P-type ATPase [Pirellulaceae bacterium]
ELANAAKAALPIPAATDFRSTAGRGVRARVDGREISVGGWEFCATPMTKAEREGASSGGGASRGGGVGGGGGGGLVQISLGPLPPPEPEPVAPSWSDSPWRHVVEQSREQGHTAVFVAVDRRVVGVALIADPPRREATSVVRELKRRGLKLRMLTGDNRRTAQNIASELGIDDVSAELLPRDKIAAVRQLRAEGRRVAMVGDGVNDAPALAAADVGIALGSGSDVAIESGGVTLLRGDLTGVVRSLELSRLVMRNIRQNLFFAFAYNAIGIPLAAGVLAPLAGVTLSPMLAAAAMSFSSVSVISNALRLRGAS